MRGDPESGSFSLAYLKDGHLIARDYVNKAKGYVQARKLNDEGLGPNPETLSDTGMTLKEVLTRLPHPCHPGHGIGYPRPPRAS